MPSTTIVSLPLVSVNSAAESRIEAEATGRLLIVVKVMSIQPRDSSSTRSITCCGLGSRMRDVGASTRNCSTFSWFGMPPVSENVPARKVTVYAPAASVPVKE